jgi:hypothetical protein
MKFKKVFCLISLLINIINVAHCFNSANHNKVSLFSPENFLKTNNNGREKDTTKKIGQIKRTGKFHFYIKII